MNSVDTTSLVLQILSLQILMRDYNNTDIMQELQRQDNEYFEKILSNQAEILNTIKERTNNNGRENN
jgi:hypothetical protein